MSFRNVFLLMFLSLGVSLSGQEILISNEGTVSVCSGFIKDSGGSLNDYENNEDYTLTVCSDDTTGCLQLDFISFNLEQGFDQLTIYNGAVANGTPIAELSGDISPGILSSNSSCLTLVFTSDGSITREGFEIEVSCICPTCDDGLQNGSEIGIDCGGGDCEPCDDSILGQLQDIVYTCSTTVYDNGYLGDYLNNSNDVLTICSESADDCLRATFLEFDVFGTTSDLLFVYAGQNISAPLIGAYNQGNPPPESIQPGSECLTFQLVTNGTQTGEGFVIDISCQCPTCFDGMLNGAELGVDCGGPDCVACDDIILGQNTGTVTTCSDIVLDSGGILGDYQNDENHVITLCSDDPNNCIQLDFTSFDLELNFDFLTVYSGSSATGNPIAELTGNTNPGSINAGSECLTLVFTSDNTVTSEGFEAEISCICPTCDDGVNNGLELGVDCGGPDCEPCDFLVMGQTAGTVTSCSTTIYDNGFQDDYFNDSNEVLTVCAESADDCLQAAFLLFDINSTVNDWLFIYAGDDVNAPLIGGFNQGNPPPTTIESGSQCLTFEFVSNGSFTSDGFIIDITCQCPTCDDGILNGQEIVTDCGGPDCPPCDFNSISEEATVTACEGTLFDSGLTDNYGPNEDFTMTYCAPQADQCMKVEFAQLGIAIADFLYVFDGDDTTAEQLAVISAAVAHPDIYASGQCLTFQFVSDNVGAGAGFELNLSCDCATSLSEFDGLEKEALFISPNPSEGIIRLEVQLNTQAEAYVLSDDGRIIMRESLAKGANPEIDVSILASGRYQLLLITVDRYMISPLVKY